mgnify:CR=1 FL=1
MINMYTIKKQFYMALGIFSFFTLCGFLSIPISSRTDFFINDNSKKSAFEGIAPFKVLIYSTTIPLKEYQIKEELTVNNLAPGEYMIVVSGGNNHYRSKTITLRQE